jgi:DNA-binding Lrp family transcriptional regulator
MMEKQPPPLDAADLRLLALMQADATATLQTLAEAAHLSPATAHRRLRRLQEAGLIERQVAVLSRDKLAALVGRSLTALVEVTLDVQAHERLDAFEARAVARDEVQQCWRVSPGPDFVLVVEVADMDGYQALARVLFTEDANVRQVRAYFATKRAKFSTASPLVAAWAAAASR